MVTLTLSTLASYSKIHSCCAGIDRTFVVVCAVTDGHNGTVRILLSASCVVATTALPLLYFVPMVIMTLSAIVVPCCLVRLPMVMLTLLAHHSIVTYPMLRPSAVVDRIAGLFPIYQCCMLRFIVEPIGSIYCWG
jgi:hypothetical protein